MSQIKANKVVRIWDLPTRLFHWLLVLTVSVALVTGLVAPASWLVVHTYAGYAIVGLIVFRLVWGFFGGQFSRFRSFYYSPGRVIEHLRGLIRLRPQHYLGHNPSGAAMILVLFLTLTGLTVTGLMAFGGENKQGVLAGFLTYAMGHKAKELHEPLAFALMAMVAVHIIGVAVDSRLVRQNLVAAMTTGNKYVPLGMSVATAKPTRHLAASASLLLIAATAAPILFLLLRVPPFGVPDIPVNQLYAKECGDCHYAYSPSLLPESSWRGLMATLEDHFGEDASLDAPDRVEIANWLMANSAEHWDTEAAHRFRRVSDKAPGQITATHYWRRKHRKIDQQVYARKGIRNEGNCIACHLDADTGLFDARSLSIPAN